MSSNQRQPADPEPFKEAQEGPAGLPYPDEAIPQREAVLATNSVASARSQGEVNRYRRTDFASMQHLIDAAAFYEAAYDPNLHALISAVLEAEAPISETLLVQRIARAHGFQRAGRIIRNRVMTEVARRHRVVVDGSESFVWTDDSQRAVWRTARAPLSEDDVRQIEEIALEELGAVVGTGDPVSIARFFGVRRLSLSARSRIEQAIARETREAAE
jgi:hypothetical protein